MGKIQLPIDLLVLRAFFEFGSGSLNAHPPLGVIIRYLPRELRANNKTVKKSVKRLVAKGYLIEHPTRGNITYFLSKMGRDYILNS